MSAFKAFKQFIKSPFYLNLNLHRKGCKNTNNNVPVNECTCYCYELNVYRAGYLAAKGQVPTMAELFSEN